MKNCEKLWEEEEKKKNKKIKKTLQWRKKKSLYAYAMKSNILHTRDKTALRYRRDEIERMSQSTCRGIHWRIRGRRRYDDDDDDDDDDDGGNKNCLPHKVTYAAQFCFALLYFKFVVLFLILLLLLLLL